MSRRSPSGYLLQWRILLSLFFCLSLALAPSLAEARAGHHIDQTSGELIGMLAGRAGRGRGARGAGNTRRYGQG